MTFRFYFSYYLREKSNINTWHKAEQKRMLPLHYLLRYMFCIILLSCIRRPQIDMVMHCLSKTLRTQNKTRFLKKKKKERYRSRTSSFDIAASLIRMTFLIQFLVAKETPSGQMISSNGINKNLSTYRRQILMNLYLLIAILI